jgi:hypothetical protein
MNTEDISRLIFDGTIVSDKVITATQQGHTTIGCTIVPDHNVATTIAASMPWNPSAHC